MLSLLLRVHGRRRRIPARGRKTRERQVRRRRRRRVRVARGRDSSDLRPRQQRPAAARGRVPRPRLRSPWRAARPGISEFGPRGELRRVRAVRPLRLALLDRVRRGGRFGPLGLLHRRGSGDVCVRDARVRGAARRLRSPLRRRRARVRRGPGDRRARDRRLPGHLGVADDFRGGRARGGRRRGAGRRRRGGLRRCGICGAARSRVDRVPAPARRRHGLSSESETRRRRSRLEAPGEARDAVRGNRLGAARRE
mmetsp:Transcript_4699/g.14717  ORF Transcript_4699/g.14717 Transcript_4699/m.14717 type:complete len:253 (-) Transcript_4699:121-879(-)